MIKRRLPGAGRRRNADQQAGTITLLTIGLFAVLTLMVVAVVDVSAVYLDRRDLAGECDSAALAASQATDPATLYREGVGAALPVTAEAGSAAAQTVARTVGAGTTTTTSVLDGQVTVTCTRTVRLPVGAALGVRAMTIRAGSTARSPVR